MIIFSEAFQRAGILTGPAFCDTDHGLEFFPAVIVAVNLKCCENRKTNKQKMI